VEAKRHEGEYLMDWVPNQVATKAARDAFPESPQVRVKQHGRQYLIEPTRHGRVAILPLTKAFLVAAERPPFSAEACVDVSGLDAEIRHYLDNNRLRPWKIVHETECIEVIHSLAASEDGQDPDDELAPEFSQYVAPLWYDAELVGESRGRCFENLTALVATQRPAGPLVQLSGPESIGKRTMAAALARHGYRLVGELALARLLVRRVFSTVFELVIDTLLAGGRAMGPEDLLVVSDAELLTTLPRPFHKHVLRELARLPHVVLTARPGPRRPVVPHLVTLEVPGWTLDEARSVVSGEYPELEFAGSALGLLLDGCRSSAGVIPGRLFYLIDLSRALVGSSACPGSLSSPYEEQGRPEDREVPPAERTVLAPDEITAAMTLVRSAWTAKAKKQ
jgi:hypothetical protein